MPRQTHHSRPPSWSTLFPPNPTAPHSHDPASVLPEWKLPKYSPKVEEGPPDWREGPPETALARGADRFWARHGKRIAAGLAICCLVSTGLTALLLLRQPVGMRAADELEVVPDFLDQATVELPAPTQLPQPELEPVVETPPLTPEEEYKTYIAQYLNGPPSETFEENLRPDVQYITGWIGAGWTNDVMTYANLLHLALLTQRIPILGPFAPSHLPQEAGYPAFGDVFDVPRLSKALGIPILEWRDVKDAESAEWDIMGCWSTWLGMYGEARPSLVPSHLRLDVSYTAIPDHFKMFPDNPGDPHVSLNKILQLAYPSGRTSALAQHQPIPAKVSGLALEPSEQLVCYDFLYFTSVDTYFEWWYDWSPQWRLVGTHMHWTPRLEGIASGYLRRHFGVGEDEAVPPYIAIHARRGDFRWACETNDAACLPSQQQMQRRVAEMQAALAQRGVQTDRVLVTSDEQSAAWWQGVLDLGYTYINHTALGTEETYGLWYGPILDAVFQSMGAAVIGTDRSTMSLLAERRAQDWQNGPTARLVFSDVPTEES